MIVGECTLLLLGMSSRMRVRVSRDCLYSTSVLWVHSYEERLLITFLFPRSASIWPFFQRFSIKFWEFVAQEHRMLAENRKLQSKKFEVEIRSGGPVRFRPAVEGSLSRSGDFSRTSKKVSARKMEPIFNRSSNVWFEAEQILVRSITSHLLICKQPPESKPCYMSVCHYSPYLCHGIQWHYVLLQILIFKFITLVRTDYLRKSGPKTSPNYSSCVWGTTNRIA